MNGHLLSKGQNRCDIYFLIFVAFSQYMNFSKELGNATNYLIKKTFRMVIAFRKWLRSIRILCRNYKYLNHCLQIFVLPFSQVVQNTRVQVLWEGCKIWKKAFIFFLYYLLMSKKSLIFSNCCCLLRIFKF